MFLARSTIAAFWILALAQSANAACPTFHTLTNGTPADATQVMDNFNYVLQCPGFTGQVGIGTSTPNFGGYGSTASILSIYGPSQLSAVLELATGSAVADGILGGDIAFENTNLSTEKRLAVIRGTMKGVSPNNLGGQIDIITKRDGGSFVDALTVTNNGNVGIGTTSPNSLLHLSGSAPSDSIQLNIENTGSGGQARVVLKNATRSYYAGVANSIGDSFFIYDATAAANRFDITSGGNVGIGTTSPDSLLHLSGSAPSGWIQLNIENTGSAGQARFQVKNATRTYFVGVANSIGDSFFIYDGTAAANRFNITSAGNVGIGTTTPAQALEVNGQVRIDALASASSTSLCITATTNGVVATCSSSIRYKENVKDARFGLKEVLAMRPVTFKWKGRDERDFGLIAEEVAKIDPLYVTYKNGKIEGVKYPQLTAVLINAVKGLKAANDVQAAEVAQLRSKNAALLERLKQQATAVQDIRSRLGALERKAAVHTAENLAIPH